MFGIKKKIIHQFMNICIYSMNGFNLFSDVIKVVIFSLFILYLYFSDFCKQNLILFIRSGICFDLIYFEKMFKGCVVFTRFILYFISFILSVYLQTITTD